MKRFFTYDWQEDTTNDEYTLIRIYGINELNESVCVVIDNFTPYVYAELPTDACKWNSSLAQLLCNKIDEVCGKQKPIKKSLMFKKKLYYANINKKTTAYKKFPFLFLAFSSRSDINYFIYKSRYQFIVSGIGNIKIKIHEQDASTILQLTSLKDLPTSGWIGFKGKESFDENKETLCDHEYRVNWKNMQKLDNIDDVVEPLVMGFDIEVNSVNTKAMPKPANPGDKIFQISCVFQRGNNDENLEKYLLTLGEPNQKIIGNDVEIHIFDTEADLLLGYTSLIIERNPQVIIGYNILNFDIPYMIERAKLYYIIDSFNLQSFVIGKHAEEMTIKWSSAAYKNQEFTFLNSEGRLFIDLLPVVRRDYKFSKYNLKTVADFFLGETKDPLTPQGIFKCYRLGMNGGKKGSKALGIVGKYCIQDTVLCNKLFNTMNTWIGLCEMAKVCNVPIFKLYTAGQQIKVYSQVYKYCLFNDIIVQKNGYIAKDDECYTGATVFPPIPGAYDKVIPFDFSSLYPTTIIAYNIDYSTLVIDDTVPDHLCNVIEWEDHVGCEHDKEERKTKPKKIICAARKYRFLKTPKGVLPTLLENQLQSRSTVKKEMKKNKKIYEELKKCDNDWIDCYDKYKNLWKFGEIAEKDNLLFLIKTLIDVLDKRQLAIKVSANSMYGAMGVTRGYLPFLPGAMCTTAQGRKSLLKAAHTLQFDFHGKLVYGDSVVGDEPLLLLSPNNNIVIMTIEDLCNEWKPYENFKIFDNNRYDKQQSTTNYKVWANGKWNIIKKVIRHKTSKDIYRVNTTCGCVDVTEDHSLLNTDSVKIKPNNCKIGITTLLSSYPHFEQIESTHKEQCVSIDKNITNNILNETYEKRFNFFCKYRNTYSIENTDSFCFYDNNKINMSRLYYLAKSLGNNVTIDITLSGIYEITCSAYPIKTDKGLLKKMYKLHNTNNNEYVYDLETVDCKFNAGIGQIVVANTDSCYIHFPGINTAQECWDHSLEVEEKISKIFPPPMRLAFEEKIYERFFILTKKRYMALQCGRDGIIEKNIMKKGVLLARRDNSKFIRNLYEEIIMMIFNKADKDKVLYTICKRYNELCSNSYSYKDFIVTKSIGDICDYKVRPLPIDEKKRSKRLKDLKIPEELINIPSKTGSFKNHLDEVYALKCLPANIQLAEKMRRRGCVVDAGSRIEYLVTLNGGINAKQYEKIEDPIYQQRYSDIIKLDFLYYIKLAINPLDQALSVAYKTDKFADKQYKFRLKKYKLLEELKSIYTPILKLK